ncbi:hypothetical protein BKA82DRAFT_20057 [Pisolithus tinctorius]|uniref:Uncharacterized protein n=1 Tax=Pisolithus tinctorius Marx 270 TaxID=870435 RepID=A0A0C3PEH7_PISTI|nr:hypothetical protein BKA82DRAFT_20057 [Pisolithus tinctorius]KIO12225.1 hypothetical protein M404DRAFT_20057 [Pisolithus tinctorius Marx 270]
MANLISLQLPITHPGTYHVSFMPPTSGVLTLEIMTVLPVQCECAQVQTNPMLDVKQDAELSKIFKSWDHGELEPICTSDCGEKSLTSSLFNMPVKAMSNNRADVDDSVTEPESKDENIKTALAHVWLFILSVCSSTNRLMQGDGLAMFHHQLLSSQRSSCLQESVSTFVLMRHMEALYGDLLPQFTQLDTHSKHPHSPTPPALKTPKWLKGEGN